MKGKVVDTLVFRWSDMFGDDSRTYDKEPCRSRTFLAV